LDNKFNQGGFCKNPFLYYFFD